MNETSNDQSVDSAVSPPGGSAGQSWFDRNKANLGLGVLILYVFLLGLGTVGELWDVEWILDLPLFRPPGKD